MKIDINGWTTDDGHYASSPMAERTEKTAEENADFFNMSEINRVLSGKLTFGNIRQIRAIKAYATLALYKEKESEFYS